MHKPIEQNPRIALRLLVDSINSMRGKYAVFFLVVLIGVLVNLLPPQLYKLFFQYIETPSAHAVTKLVVFGVSVAVASMIATALSIYAREWLRCATETMLRQNVLRALSNTSLQQLETVNRGEWIACTSKDLSGTEEFLTVSFPDQLRNMLMFLGSSTLFLYYGGWFGALLLALAVLLVFLNVRIQKKMQPALHDIRNLHSDVYQQLLESFEGLRTIRSFSGEQRVQENFSHKLIAINKKSLVTMRLFSSLIGTNELFILSGMTAVLALIVQQVNAAHMSFEDALVYPFYMGIFFSSVAGFYRSNFDWTMFFTEGARLANLIYNFGNVDRPLSTDQSNMMQQSILSSKMSFSRIDLRFPGQPPLRDLFDICVEKHRLIGIIGPSGCGKSTLLEFLAGLRPLEVNGQPTLLSTSLTSYVEQKPYIFEGTVCDNLRFGCNENVADEQIWQALEKVRLAELFRGRGGLDFYIYERGQNLSEGEKYRLGIARAILAQKPYLLLDEPFAALDPISIEAIVSLLHAERSKRGIVVVTHYQPASLCLDDVIDFSHLNTNEVHRNHVNYSPQLSAFASM